MTIIAVCNGGPLHGQTRAITHGNGFVHSEASAEKPRHFKPGDTALRFERLSDGEVVAEPTRAPTITLLEYRFDGEKFQYLGWKKR